MSIFNFCFLHPPTSLPHNFSDQPGIITLTHIITIYLSCWLIHKTSIETQLPKEISVIQYFNWIANIFTFLKLLIGYVLSDFTKNVVKILLFNYFPFKYFNLWFNCFINSAIIQRVSHLHSRQFFLLKVAARTILSNYWASFLVCNKRLYLCNSLPFILLCIWLQTDNVQIIFIFKSSLSLPHLGHFSSSLIFYFLFVIFLKYTDTYQIVFHWLKIFFQIMHNISIVFKSCHFIYFFSFKHTLVHANPSFPSQPLFLQSLIITYPRI